MVDGLMNDIVKRERRRESRFEQSMPLSMSLMLKPSLLTLKAQATIGLVTSYY
jgi:hypothetical protein